VLSTSWPTACAHDRTSPHAPAGRQLRPMKNAPLVFGAGHRSRKRARSFTSVRSFPSIADSLLLRFVQRSMVETRADVQRARTPEDQRISRDWILAIAAPRRPRRDVLTRSFLPAVKISAAPRAGAAKSRSPGQQFFRRLPRRAAAASRRTFGRCRGWMATEDEQELGITIYLSTPTTSEEKVRQMLPIRNDPGRHLRDVFKAFASLFHPTSHLPAHVYRAFQSRLSALRVKASYR